MTRTPVPTIGMMHLEMSKGNGLVQFDFRCHRGEEQTTFTISDKALPILIDRLDRLSRQSTGVERMTVRRYANEIEVDA